MLVAADSDPMENTLKRAIIYVHVLDQSAGATRFRMHRDVEEDSNILGKGFRLRVKHTVVLLLDAGPNQVPGLYVAGAEEIARCRRRGHRVASGGARAPPITGPRRRGLEWLVRALPPMG